MSTRNWFRTHRRQVAIHSSVIVGFLLFTLFAAEPLFDRLERIPGEAQLHRLDLPVETGGMSIHIDELTTDGQTAVEIRGWAFIDGQDSENSEIFIVLTSGRRTYIFDTMVQERPDVTSHFGDLGLNLDSCGFSTMIPVRKIAEGEYVVGIYIRKGDVEALQYTNRSLVKSRGTIELTG